MCAPERVARQQRRAATRKTSGELNYSTPPDPRPAAASRETTRREGCARRLASEILRLTGKIDNLNFAKKGVFVV
jgi:hypothetical protein